MSQAPAIERLLRRDRAITFAGLAALCTLAWLYTASGAGLGMSAWEMTRFTLFPHLHAAGAGSPSWTWATWTLMILMWWVMMIAMMTPSAAPTILLYARVFRHAGGHPAADRADHGLAPTGAFVAGYLLVWLGFAALATVLHWTLERSGLVSAMMMGSRSAWLSGAVLTAAGLYQLSALKNACLAHCRSPASFLARHWRPHLPGALRLGALHGAYCVGCCWLLMALLFVGGVMNLAWIAALSILVMIEKTLPAGLWIRRGTGIALIGWGAATLIV